MRAAVWKLRSVRGKRWDDGEGGKVWERDEPAKAERSGGNVQRGCSEKEKKRNKIKAFVSLYCE